MSKSTVIVLLFCIILSSISFFIGYLRPPKMHSWLAKGSFFVSTFILVPFLATVLYFQSTAESRLSETGVLPYPDIIETVGIAFGRGDDPVWVFRTAKGSNIQNFYNFESNRPGWVLKENSENSLVFEKNGKEMKISLHEQGKLSSIIYRLENK